jgi:hypothetical protein
MPADGCARLVTFPATQASAEDESTDEDFLADVYGQCCDAIKPAVDRGLLPGSVVESLQILVAEKLATQAPSSEARDAEREELEHLRALVNSPETRDFLIGARNEVAHQVEKWGTVHDRAKAPADWFWLVGYLGGKALAAHLAGDTEKAMHHCISTSAALANWHTHILHGAGLMQPGSSDLQDFLRDTFGANFIEYQGRAAIREGR